MADNPFTEDDQTDLIVKVSDIQINLNSLILVRICNIKSIKELLDTNETVSPSLSDSGDVPEVSHSKSKKRKLTTDIDSSSKLDKDPLRLIKSKIKLDGYQPVDVVKFFRLIYPGYNAELEGRTMFYLS